MVAKKEIEDDWSSEETDEFNNESADDIRNDSIETVKSSHDRQKPPIASVACFADPLKLR